MYIKTKTGQYKYPSNCAQGRLIQFSYTIRIYATAYINELGVRKYYVNAIHILYYIGNTFILNSCIRLYIPLHRITVINCTR